MAGGRGWLAGDTGGWPATREKTGDAEKGWMVARTSGWRLAARVSGRRRGRLVARAFGR
jgi:hypothetical protein